MNLTAHRGLSSLAPENTLGAFQMAIDFGCQWIEIDVQLTQDFVPVVIHDQTVDRCTNGKGKVADLTWHELRILDAGSWFDEDFHREHIPSLAETLTLVKNAGIHLNIELKTYPEDDIELLCERVAQIVIESEISSEQLLFSSFRTEALISIAQHLPEVKRGHLWQEIPEAPETTLQQIDAYSVHCDYRYLTEQQAKHIKSMGYQLFCYTANVPLQVEAHWQWGVDMMITDMPQRYCDATAPESVLNA